jgi:LysM repeat protein
MYSFVTSAKIWLVLGTVVIMLLNGCASNPPNDNTQTETAVYHYVNPGDTLESIAKTYGREPLEIARWNNLMPPYKLETHQKLLVSGPPNGIGTTSEITPVPDYGPVKSRPIKKTTPKNNVNKKKATPKPTPKSAPKTNVSSKSYHQVQRGETLYSIAKRYGQDYRDVAAWNNLTARYDLAVGQRVVVSGASRQAKPSTATTPIPAKSASKQKYVVQQGDTLYSIAKRFGYSMSDIMAWNGLSADELPLGKTLIVSPPTASSFKPVETTHNKEYHTVAAGETVYSLSRRYGYSVDQIAQWNNLPASHSLSVGQRVRVSPPTGSPKVSQAKQSVSQAKTSATNATKCHLVKSGETLYSISKQYGYDVAMVAGWNNIPQPYTVRVGRNLRVSPITGGNVCH